MEAVVGLIIGGLLVVGGTGVFLQVLVAQLHATKQRK